MMSDNPFENESKKKESKVNHDALAVRNIMINENGRAYMWKHLQSCGIFESIFNPDPIQHAYNAGVREAGLRIKRDLELYESDYYIKMIKENIDE